MFLSVYTENYRHIHGSVVKTKLYEQRDMGK